MMHVLLGVVGEHNDVIYLLLLLVVARYVLRGIAGVGLIFFCLLTPSRKGRDARGISAWSNL